METATGTSPAPPEGDAGAGADSTQDLLATIVAESSGREGDAKAARAWLDQLRQQIARGEVESPERVEAALAAQIADIDTLLGAQLNEILHAPAFQKLEAGWRGLHHLVSNTDTSSLLRIRVLDASMEDMRRDLEGAEEFDMSVLFQKVYEEEYGVLGGDPFGLLIGDYEFSNHPQDIALLQRFSNVAAAAHAPLIAAASPAIFGWESYDELPLPRDLARIFTGPEYVKWRAFRDSEDSRYVGLTLPRILLREPWDPVTCPVESFCFREDVSGADRSKYLWGNAAYAFASCVAGAFALTSWCAKIRGVQGGGMVEKLPHAQFDTGEGELVPKGPTEASVSDLREKELADLGFISLVHRKGTHSAVFYSTQSSQKPKVYDKEEATASARLSIQLQYILCASRFAHYLKVMVRDKTGTLMTARECETYLNSWLVDYCIADPASVGESLRASRPLRSGKVTVQERRLSPGRLDATILLQPHFMLDELNVLLRLVTEIPQQLVR